MHECMSVGVFAFSKGSIELSSPLLLGLYAPQEARFINHHPLVSTFADQLCFVPSLNYERDTRAIQGNDLGADTYGASEWGGSKVAHIDVHPDAGETGGKALRQQAMR